MKKTVHSRVVMVPLLKGSIGFIIISLVLTALVCTFTVSNEVKESTSMKLIPAIIALGTMSGVLTSGNKSNELNKLCMILEMIIIFLILLTTNIFLCDASYSHMGISVISILIGSTLAWIIQLMLERNNRNNRKFVKLNKTSF